MVYQEEVELKRKFRRSNLSMKVVAAELGWPPSTLSAKLNGYAPLAFNERNKIEELIRKTDEQENNRIAPEKNKNNLVEASTKPITSRSILTSGRFEVPCFSGGKSIKILLDVNEGKLAGISLAN